MDSTRARGSFASIPAWLEIQNLTEESLRAVITGLGIEILGALCARAEPVPARVRFCSLSARTFTSTMYTELCRYMESCLAGRGSERTVVPGLGKDAEEFGEPAEVLRIKIEDSDSVGPEEEGRDPDDGAERELLMKLFCTTCSRSFATKAGLKMHMKRHRPVSTDKKYKCPDCPFSTHNKSNFTTHTRIHTGERPFTCLVCGKGFNQSSTCQAHMRIHTGERPYVCTVCGKGFSELSQCQVHMRIHTGERPYSCNVCAKSFSDRSTLKRHMLTHTGEMPYICSVCSKAFSQSSSCKKHMRIHTGERPYTCTVCTKSFSVSSTLRQHMRIHTGEKPYSCSVCGKAFIQSASYQRHIQIHMR
uniref:C2H2-type domain-containing protein n=1 Tax=Eptatretus burgeri TaxID=7764 RepID=A0A8C4QC73_EPTBU